MSDQTDYKPATRDDLKPGAVFAVRDPDWAERYATPIGTRLVVERDDGDETPMMRREDGAFIDGRPRMYVGLHRLEAVPSNTVTIPKSVAEAWLRTVVVSEDAMGSRSARQAVLQALRAAMAEFKPEVVAARSVLEAHGYTVTRAREAV
jgi:hypothetical protein